MQVDASLLRFRDLYRRVVLESAHPLGEAPKRSFEEIWRDLTDVNEFQKVERLDGARLADLRGLPQFRNLVDRLAERFRFSATLRPAISLAVASWGEAEGRTTLAFNLARDIATRFGLRVALIDYDFSHPEIKETLRLTPIYGLKELIEQPMALDLRDVGVLVRADRLMVIPTVGGLPRHIKRAAGVGAFLHRLMREVDVAIIDTPRFVENDFTVLSLLGLVHSTLLLKSRNTPRMEFQAMVDRLKEHRAPVLGYVENMVP